MGAPSHARGWAAIDLLRFACAMLVVAHHYGAALPLHPNPVAAAMLRGASLPGWLAGWTSFGWVGVELFFVISGYVIACSAIGAEPRAFLRRRAQRLLPAAWLCATLTLVVLLAMQASPAAVLGAQWLRSVAFSPIGDAIDPSYWTLGIEVGFYLIVAWRLRGGSSPERIERTGIWIGVASLAFWAAQAVSGSIGDAWMNERLAQLLLLPHGVFFAIGVVVHGWHRAGPSLGRAAGLAAFAGAATIEIAVHAAAQARDLGVSASPGMPLAVFALGLATVAGCRLIQPRLDRVCGWSAVLGLMTYPLYLLHQQVGAAFAAVLGPAGFVLALAVSLGASLAIVRLAEPPLRRLIGQVVSERRAPRPDMHPIASP